MKSFWNLKELPFSPYLFSSLAINVFLGLMILTIRRNLPPQVPLFYGLAEGENQLAPSWALVTPALVSITVILVNSFIAMVVKDTFLKKTLLATAIGTTFFSAITILKIIFLVGSF